MTEIIISSPVVSRFFFLGQHWPDVERILSDEEIAQFRREWEEAYTGPGRIITIPKDTKGEQ